MSSELANDPVPAGLFDAIYRRHGHRCPMSTLGGRLGHAARRRFSRAQAAAGLLAVYGVRTCALDGIAQATGCRVEDGSLIVREQGRHALTLVRREDGRGVAAELTRQALALAGDFRRHGENLQSRRAHLAPAELAAAEAARERALDELLKKLRGLAEEELVTVRPAVLDLKVFSDGGT